MIPGPLEPFAVPIDDLVLLDGNPRQGDLPSIEASLTEFGQRVPIVYRTEGNKKVVYAGNHRLAARRLGWTRIAAVSADDLTEAQVRAFSLADNRTGDLGVYDDDALAAMLTGLSDTSPDLLASTGYDEETVRLLTGTYEQRSSGTTFGDEPEEFDDVAYEHTCPKCSYRF